MRFRLRRRSFRTEDCADHHSTTITTDSRIACIPIYALTPYLFEGSGTIPSAHEPALDPSAEKLLTALLDRIR